VRHGDSSSLKELFFIITVDGTEWEEKGSVVSRGRGRCVQVNDRGWRGGFELA
jgi:hypothetical protein